MIIFSIPVTLVALVMPLLNYHYLPALFGASVSTAEEVSRGVVRHAGLSLDMYCAGVGGCYARKC